MKILLATDGSKFSDAATQTIISQCRPQGAEVKVLNVVDVSFPIPTSYASKFREESLKNGQAFVRQAEQPLTKAGFKVETAVEEGDPKAKIVEDAARWHVDLIIVGSHGRKGLERFLMGSVSAAVARHALCSVQVVRLPKYGHRTS